MTSPITEQILNGNRRAIARLLTHVENKHPRVQAVLNDLYPHTGRAHLVGVTGAPGTGKSSLVNKLVKAYRRREKQVAVVAVDPTSPFSGGAILGDRVRMQELSGDPGVFIRSLASRGSLGGLARAVDDALKVLEAAGFDPIIIETVGAGQGEVEIAKTAHTTLVVEAPGLGDDVQAIKAGILEIADIFLVNKADHPGVERTVTALRAMLELGQGQTGRFIMDDLELAKHHPEIVNQRDEISNLQSPTLRLRSGQVSNLHWEIPVVKTIAIKEEGIEEAVDAIEAHLAYLKESGELAHRHRSRLLDELERTLQTELMRQVVQALPAGYLADVLAQLAKRTLTPYAAVQAILAKSRE